MNHATHLKPEQLLDIISYLQVGIKMSLPNPLSVGIDVPKASLDGFEAIQAELTKQLSVSLVLMEATSGLEAHLACFLQAAGFQVAVINPRQARDSPFGSTLARCCLASLGSNLRPID